MDGASSCTVEDDDEMRALNSLLEAFGSFCSLEEIGYAYCHAKKDLNKAGEILFDLRESNFSGVPQADNNEKGAAQSNKSLQVNGHSTLAPSDPKALKPKKLSASVGTVSSVLGKSYARATSSKNNGSSRTTKPPKVVLKEPLPEEHEVIPSINDFRKVKEPIRDAGVAEFLFTMLGDGFNLNLDVIYEVLGHCGYDAKKSMEKLLVISDKSLEKGKSIDYEVAEKLTDKCPKVKPCLSAENLTTYSAERTEKVRSNIPRELIEALFVAPEKSEEEPKRKLEWGLNRKRVVGQKVVNKPLDDVVSTPPNYMAKLRCDIENVPDEEDEYHILRRAAKQNWEVMKAYYEAAIDAFTCGNRAQADYLLEQGQHYNKVAREADEKSTRKIIGTSNDEQPTVPLDLRAQRSKEALRLLKFHLHQLAGIPSLKYLKVILNPDGEDSKKGKQRRLVTQLLEKASIKWTDEEGCPGTILIQLDVLDPDNLHFTEDDD